MNVESIINTFKDQTVFASEDIRETEIELDQSEIFELSKADQAWLKLD